MNKSSGISYLNPKDKHGSVSLDYQETIDRLAEDAVRSLSEMLQSMFDGVDDSLFELANNARTNNEQNRFFEAMREIRIKRKGIESGFSQAIRNSFSAHAVNRSQKDLSPTQNSETLSLVGNDDLEQDVAIKSMASKAQSNFQGPLLQFHTRIGKLYGAQHLAEISPPLDPDTICKAFAVACDALDVEIKEKLIVYKQFDRYVMSNLESVLEHANRTLIRKGVMPSLKTPGIRNKTSPRRERASQPLEQQTRTQENTPPFTEDLFPELQSLLASARNSSTRRTTTYRHSQEANSANHVIDSDGLLQLLNALQKAPHTELFSENNSKVVDIRSAIHNQLKRNAKQQPRGSQLSQIDEDLINLVSMLFEFILDDYNLAPPIQVLISRLQIPILKVVIKDKSFFNSNKHPARQLLNSLAKAGIGWGEAQDKGKDLLYSRIQQTVKRVLDEFDGDIRLFEQLNKEFNEFIRKENRKAKIVEQRTKEAEEGRIRSKQAQRKVEHILSRKILNARHAIPQVVIDMLKNGWSRVMFLAYLKDDQEHQWANTVRIAEELIWCLQPLSDQKDRQKWITIVPKLLKELKAGLESVSYNASQLEQTITEIKSSLTSCFKDSSACLTQETMITDTPVSKTEKEKRSSSESELNRPKESVDDNLGIYLTQVDQLQIGQWVEFSLMNGNKFRCKLASKIDEADCLIFVNRMGLKSVEKDKLELANDLRAKKAVILEQGLMIDRAMNAVMSSLRQKADV